MKQKSIFLSGEANAWFLRNQDSLKNKDFSQDLVVNEIIEIITNSQIELDLKRERGRLLEIGCGEVGRGS